MEFTKPGMHNDIVEIWFGIANGQLSSIFDRVIYLRNKVSFQDNNLSKSQWMFTKIDRCIDIGVIWALLFKASLA